MIPVLRGVVTCMRLCLDSSPLQRKQNTVSLRLFRGLNHIDERALLSWRRGYGSSVREPCTIKDKARNQDDRLPDLDEISLAEVGLALKSHLLAPRANQQRRWNLRFKAQRPRAGGMSKDILTFRSRFAPQRLKSRSRWRQVGLNLARPKMRNVT